MAEAYLASKSRGEETRMVYADMEALAELLPEGARVLDLGCGAGVPATQWLAQRFHVTGVDISERQLELARQHVPGATFIKSDMGSLTFPDGAFDAIVSFYAIIHLPRQEQSALIANIYRWLKSGGAFLSNWAVSDWEGVEENWEGWGASMWWSHYGKDDNLAMLRDVGFIITSSEVRKTNDETWLWVLARKTDVKA